MCEIYWEKANTSPSAPPTFCGEQCSVPNLWLKVYVEVYVSESEKIECQGGLKAWGPHCISC